MLLGILRTLRPHQWVKNLFVALPLVFAKRLTDRDSVIRAGAGVLLFCLLSGSVYLLNDVADLEKDRAHPKKRNRPIASGRVSPRVALMAAALLATIALGVGLVLDVRFALVAAAYVLQNLAYSFWLKHVAFVDVSSIALGFFLRVLAGALVIPVPASGWLLLVTSLLAAFLGFGKRTHELASAMSAGVDVERQRKVLAQYRLEHLKLALYGLGGATSVAYLFYTLSAHTQTFFQTQWMWLSAPFCMVGIARFVWLVQRSPRGESPTDEMLRDPLFLLNLVLWAACVTLIIYKG